MNVGEAAGPSGMKLGMPPDGDGLAPVAEGESDGDDVAAGKQAARQSAIASPRSANGRCVRLLAIECLGRLKCLLVTNRGRLVRPARRSEGRPAWAPEARTPQRARGLP